MIVKIIIRFLKTSFSVSGFKACKKKSFEFNKQKGQTGVLLS